MPTNAKPETVRREISLNQPNRRVRTRTHGGMTGKAREVLPMLIIGSFEHGYWEMIRKRGGDASCEIMGTGHGIQGITSHKKTGGIVAADLEHAIVTSALSAEIPAGKIRTGNVLGRPY